MSLFTATPPRRSTGFRSNHNSFSRRAQVHLLRNPADIIASAILMESAGTMGDPPSLKRVSISAQVEVPLNCKMPQLIFPFESGRATLTPWDSHWISFSMVSLFLTGKTFQLPISTLAAGEVNGSVPLLSV